MVKYDAIHYMLELPVCELLFLLKCMPLDHVLNRSRHMKYRIFITCLFCLPLLAQDKNITETVPDEIKSGKATGAAKSLQKSKSSR